MSADVSFASLGPICSIDLSSVQNGNLPEKIRIEKVSKAMESVFVGQLTAEMGKSIDGSSDTDNGPYQDFIQQAMTQGVTQGGGFGLAKLIENSLTQHDHAKAAGPMKLEVKNNSYHVNHTQ